MHGHENFLRDTSEGPRAGGEGRVPLSLGFPARDPERERRGRVVTTGGIGSVMAIVALVLAVWSASGYVAAFIRTANAVYDMPGGPPGLEGAAGPGRCDGAC